MMKAKYFFAQVKEVNERARTIEAIASTSDLDRQNDIILPGAFKESLSSFKTNPVILATHQHRLATGSSPVIGSAVPDSIEITDTEFLFTMGFAGTPLGEEYWQLYRDKHMRAFSIGFIPIEWEDKKDEQAGYIRTYTKIELLEISAVPVPSNRRALARAKGFYDQEELKEVLAEVVKELIVSQPPDVTKQISDLKTFFEEGIEDVKSLLITDSDRFAEELLLGSKSDPPDSGGDITAEQSLKRIEKALQFGDKKNADK